MLVPQVPVSYQEVVSDLVLEQYFGAGRKGEEMEKQVSPPCGAKRNWTRGINLGLDSGAVLWPGELWLSPHTWGTEKSFSPDLLFVCLSVLLSFAPFVTLSFSLFLPLVWSVFDPGSSTVTVVPWDSTAACCRKWEMDLGAPSCLDSAFLLNFRFWSAFRCFLCFKKIKAHLHVFLCLGRELPPFQRNALLPVKRAGSRKGTSFWSPGTWFQWACPRRECTQRDPNWQACREQLGPGRCHLVSLTWSELQLLLPGAVPPLSGSATATAPAVGASALSCPQWRVWGWWGQEGTVNLSLPAARMLLLGGRAWEPLLLTGLSAALWKCNTLLPRLGLWRSKLEKIN